MVKGRRIFEVYCKIFAKVIKFFYNFVSSLDFIDKKSMKECTGVVRVDSLFDVSLC